MPGERRRRHGGRQGLSDGGSLLAFHAVAGIDPVGAEVMGEEESLNVGESHAVQEKPGGGDVRAVFPGAASAVEDNGPGAGEAVDAAAEGLKTSGRGGGTGVLGAGDVGLLEKHEGTDLEDERMTTGLELAVEGRGLDELIGGNAAGGLGPGARRKSDEGDDGGEDDDPEVMLRVEWALAHPEISSN
jgi:hypothetical protein